MNRPLPNFNQPLYKSLPLPCPYISEEKERRIFTALEGPDARLLYDLLIHAGFRRSHNIVYKPACSDCGKCLSLRVLVRDFSPSRSQKRILSRNQDLKINLCPAIATKEQHDLFLRYMAARHKNGEMSEMSWDSYREMIEGSSVQTQIIELRDDKSDLLGACLTDFLADGLSAVYSFFDPDLPRRSLGTFMVLRLLEEAKRRGLLHVYLGFWIRECRKMSYKTQFTPSEIFIGDSWQDFVPA